MKLTQITIALITILMLSACGSSDSGTTPLTNENPTEVNGTSVTNEDSSNNDNTNNSTNENEETENNNSTDNTNAETNNPTDETDSTEVNNDASVWNVSTVSQFRQALLDAADNQKHDIIKLSAGTYSTNDDNLKTFSFDDSEEYNLTITSADGLSLEDVILSGNNENQVLNFSNSEKSTLIIKNISVKDGNTTINGGGVYSNQNMIVENSKFFNNEIHRFAKGGAIYVEYRVKVINSEFLNNYANSKGGAIRAKSILVDNSIFSNNTAKGSGGAIASDTTQVLNSTFSKNISTFNSGGAISSTSVNIKNSNFTNNSANFGGVLSLGVKKSIVANCTFSNNHANVQVGTIRGAAYLILVNSVFFKNTDKNKKYLIATGFTNMSNNVFIENEGAVSGYGAFINNIFLKNNYDIVATGNSKIYNNYIDFSKTYDQGNVVVKKDNLQTSDIGSIVLANDNSLTSGSPLINQGLNPNSTIYREIIKDDIINTDEGYEILKELLTEDKLGNKRIHNETIDIGAIEFGSSK